MKQKPQVMIIGRVNVGKSTLFNRLSKRVKSITLDYEGVTRDFMREEVGWKEVLFDLIDTGGIHLKKSQDSLFEAIRKQVIELVYKADVILFMVDGTVGVLPEDRELATFVFKLNKPVVLVVNKIDSKQAQEHLYEFERLGFKNVVPLSAEHGKGISELLDSIAALLPAQVSHKPEEKPAYRVMMLGKPNVGKSSLMNALLQEERSIVSEVPGTTREAISEQITFYKEAIKITDVPGVRRKRAVTDELETLMVKSAFAALRKSDIVLLLIDGSSYTLVDQELKLAFYVFQEEYKALILLINKSDIMMEESEAGLKQSMEMYEHLLKKIPVLKISCKTGKNVGRIMPLVQKVWEKASRRFDDADLLRLFIEAAKKKPLYRNKLPLLVYRVRQVRTAPITIEMVVNESNWFGPAQISFFENILRSEYDMVGVPVKFIVKKGKDLIS
jgi:GTPase